MKRISPLIALIASCGGSVSRTECVANDRTPAGGAVCEAALSVPADTSVSACASGGAPSSGLEVWEYALGGDARPLPDIPSAGWTRRSPLLSAPCGAAPIKLEFHTDAVVVRVRLPAALGAGQGYAGWLETRQP